MKLAYDPDNRILTTPVHSIQCIECTGVDDPDAWHVTALGDTVVMFCGTLAECLDACAEVEVDLDEPEAEDGPRVLDHYGQW